MKLLSENGVLLTSTVLLMGIASATQAEKNTALNIPINDKTYTATGTTDLDTAKMLVNLLRNPHLKVKASAQISTGANIKLPNRSNNSVYTAHGTTDKKTAEMLVNLLRNPHLRVQAFAQIPSGKQSQPQRLSNTNTPVYTAHGKTDLKTAKMLVNLLRNPNLLVKAEVHPRKPTANVVAKRNSTTDKYYSISGKTDAQTISKLRALLQNNQQIQMNVHSNKQRDTSISMQTAPLPPQQYLYKDYARIISQRRPFYHNGRPPTFIQGNTLWYPVPINN